MTAGYSGTPLPKKLGLRDEVLVLGDPLALDLAALEIPVDRRRSPGDRLYQVVMLFCPDTATLVDSFAHAAAAHTTGGSLWVCWPKKSSGVRTDLTETAVREYGLTHGRVDVKVAAVDATWSALKFVIRLADR